MLRSLFNRTPRRPQRPDIDALPAGELRIRLTDYAALERDLGCDQAANLQQFLARRLERELGRYDELRDASGGLFRITVRDPDAVDLDKLGQHLVAAIEGEPVSLNRALIECSATAEIYSATEAPLSVA